MNLNSDGSLTLDGVKLTPEQVRQVKAAIVPSPTRLGWWCVHNPGTGLPARKNSEATFLGSNPMFIDTSPLGGICASNHENVIFWTEL